MKKDTPKCALGLAVLLGCIFTVSTPLPAQNTPGVTEKEILIGSSLRWKGRRISWERKR